MTVQLGAIGTAFLAGGIFVFAAVSTTLRADAAALKMNGGYRAANVSGSGVTLGATTDVGLVVGGKVDLTTSTGYLLVSNSSNAVVGNMTNGTYSYLGAGQSNDFHATGASAGAYPYLRTRGSITQASPINFATQFASLRRYSTAMNALTPTACPGGLRAAPQRCCSGPYTGGNATISLAANHTNVWNVDWNTVHSIPGFNHDYPSATQPLIINISDAGTINIAAVDQGVLINQVANVLWNFPNATAINDDDWCRQFVIEHEHHFVVD